MRRSKWGQVAVALALSWMCWAGSANAALIGTWVHNYGSVIITLNLFDGQPAGRYLWQYTVDNISYDPNPGSTNGFSGFELFLPTPIPEIADIEPNPGSAPPWDVNCCSGNPVEWDRNNSDGNGIMPGGSGVFSFTTAPRLAAINDNGWFHTWQADVQTDIVSTPGMHVPFVEGLQPPLCGNTTIDLGEECDPPGSITCPAGSPAGAFLPCNAECTCEVLQTCGNAIVEPSEDCDPPGSLTCPDPSSPGGSFLACSPGCTCEPIQECGNGVLEGPEECDPPGSITCPAGSPAGAFLTCNQDCSCCVPSPEICNNMVDDDCDGLVDCDDLLSCPQPCPDIQKDPSTIKFGPPGAGLDVFKSHGRIEPGETIDMSNSDVGWVLSNARGLIWSGTLSPSQFVANATGTTFRYKNIAAKTDGGIYKAKIRISRGGTSYGFKVQAYDDLSAATDPNMSIQFYIGTTPKAYIHSEPWTRTKNGWKADGF